MDRGDVGGVCVCVSPCAARDIYVAKTGSNGNSGGAGDPYLTLSYAVNQSISGDTIRVHAGTYTEVWLTPKSGTELVSEDGLHAAKLTGGDQSTLRLANDNSGIDGFEIFGNWNQGNPIDSLVRPYGSSNTWVKNCLIHDAPTDGDLIKIGGSLPTSNVLIENCTLYNPSPRTTSGYQENIDVFGSSKPHGITVRGCWLYHTAARGGDNLMFIKGGPYDVVWENNVFGPAGGNPGNASVVVGGPNEAVFPGADTILIRNNIFVGGNGDGALGYASARNVYLYNNVFYDYIGGRAFIQFYQNGSGAASQNCFIYSNIFVKSNGKPVYDDRGSYRPVGLQPDHNLYYDVNGGGDVNIAAELHSVFEDPDFVAPAMPNTAMDTYASIVANFLLQATSPAIDAGADLSAGAPYNVPADILGMLRPTGAAYDIGVHEFGVGDVPALRPGDCEPPADGTLAKRANNVLRLVFDDAITLGVGQPVTIIPFGRSGDHGASFSYGLDTTFVTDDTLVMSEQGPVLTNLAWYQIAPLAGFNVEPFEFSVCTLIGDADGNGQVLAGDLGRIWSHNGEITDARYDIDGNGVILAGDLGAAWAHNSETAPPKP